MNKEHDFLFDDLNKTIEVMRSITNENLILKAKIKKAEEILNYSLNDFISASKTVHNCEHCNAKYLIIGKKIPGKIFNIFCSECKTLNIFNRKPIILIQL